MKTYFASLFLLVFSILALGQSPSHHLWHNLLQKHVNQNGKVSYAGFKKDVKDLENYLQLLSRETPQKGWTVDNKMAYWINAYNAFTIKLIVENYPVGSIKDISQPWGQKFIRLGSDSYSLEEIEHKILRPMNDPRIHFAINCASESCPNLQNFAFEGKNIDQQLDRATTAFLLDPSKNKLNQTEVTLSKIFKWYKEDFNTSGGVLKFIQSYTTVRFSKNTSVKYLPYDWSLNE
ncbi:MAG: DUF547 domain-containing protein [Flavobacteriaceae bacterium]